MSLEAWGDDDGADEYDPLLEAGWWTSEQVKDVVESLEKLVNVSTKQWLDKEFEMRLVLLRYAADLKVSHEEICEARKYFNIDEYGLPVHKG